MSDDKFVNSMTIDLTNCDLEAIHLPGCIQPHGILLTLKEPELTILQASANTFDLLGIQAHKLLNKSLETILNLESVNKIKKSLISKKDLNLFNPLNIFLNPSNKKLEFEGILHRYQEILFLELELKTNPEEISFIDFYRLVMASVYRLQHAATFDTLIQFVVHEIRKISGYDRVMVYQFDKEGNGVILAEEKRDGLESFLGLHYPATDIPKQARKLYTYNLLRLIVDINYIPVPIIPKEHPMGNQPLDMSFAVLRSVSPIHIEYLRNMGVRATLCISLIKEGQLWGLIACHHYSPRYISYTVRKACEFLGQIMAIELAHKEAHQDYQYYRENLKLLQTALLNTNSLEKSFIKSLIRDEYTFLELVKAQGAFVRFGEDCFLVGKTPELKEVLQLIEWLENYCHQEVFYTDCLSRLYPKAKQYKNLVSGLLAISISPSQSTYHVIWFRPEVIQTVNWAGNPHQSINIQKDGTIQLSPRKSFEKWKETVQYKSLPWKTVEIEAAQELRNSLMLAALESSEHQLRQSKELAQVTLQSIGDAVITTDAQGYIESLNPVAEELTGWSIKEVKDQPIHYIFNTIDSTSRKRLDNPVQKVLQEECIVNLTSNVLLLNKAGRERSISTSAAPIRNPQGKIVGVVLVFRDITQEQELANQLSWHACHDSLTGLINRSEFERRLKQAIQLARESSQHHAICYLDLDQFKIVNDTCGHLVGDELLCQVSDILKRNIRQSDTLARLGGDEFGLLLNQCSLDAAHQRATAICNTIRDFRFTWEDKVFSIGVSIGLVEIDRATQDLASLLSAADAACYAAKNQGRNRVHVYQADDQDLIRQRGEIRWAAQIPQAIEENRFCLYYQPIVPIDPCQPSYKHGELLLRLRDTSGQFISPMAFIPAAERYDLMKQIDRWVIKTVLKYLAEETSEGLNISELYTINLSGLSLNDKQFIEFLHEQFEIYKIAPQKICFEITETFAIANLKNAVKFIQSFKALGCSFALDDFGSGMSSFTYLKTLPVDYLKIDGGFVRDILEDAIAREIVESIHRIAKVMNIKTIAEFVENQQVLDQLKDIGIDYAQGYHIGKPQPFIMP